MSIVTVWHNLATDNVGRSVSMMEGYKAGHPLVPVSQYAGEAAKTDETLLSEAWHRFNVGDDPSFGTPCPIAVEYRTRRNRSLSVGDVVQIRDDQGTRWYACASFSWDAIEPPKWFARRASTFGTTPLDRDTEVIA